MIPMNLRRLFQTHIDATLQNFQPGLNTLAWNSMNIGASFVLDRFVARVRDEHANCA